MRAPGFNCRLGSAWHTWQTTGAEWRSQNPQASNAQAREAAQDFAGATDYPDIGQNARYRAFMECAAIAQARGE